jgi:3-hydroxyisobutyryl-CoA hydrolase
MKKRPTWSPGRLENVSEEVVSNFFKPESPYLKLVPELNIPAVPTDLIPGGMNLNPMKYALPTEEDIGSVINVTRYFGETIPVRFEEVLNRFAELRPGKLGVKEKIYEVVQRRCKVHDDADGNRGRLEWIQKISRTS